MVDAGLVGSDSEVDSVSVVDAESVVETTELVRDVVVDAARASERVPAGGIRFVGRADVVEGSLVDVIISKEVVVISVKSLVASDVKVVTNSVIKAGTVLEVDHISVVLLVG